MYETSVAPIGCCYKPERIWTHAYKPGAPLHVFTGDDMEAIVAMHKKASSALDKF